MRLSEYPFVVVRVGCSRCARQGQYRLARLADHYGSEIRLPELLTQLAAGCSFRDVRRSGGYACGAYFPDLTNGRPPDEPRSAPARTRLKLVG